jgi:hypothetical protein
MSLLRRRVASRIIQSFPNAPGSLSLGLAGLMSTSFQQVGLQRRVQLVGVRER